jgi:hypothetical protein
MNRAFRLGLSLIILAGLAPAQSVAMKTLTYRDYLDKVHGGWIGKAVGLSLGSPKEYAEPWPPSDFEYYSQIPTHFLDCYSGDDVYLPLVNQIVLKKFGTSASPEQYLKEWADRFFTGKVWVSVYGALDLGFAGVSPSLTGKPGYNLWWDDMCAQIATDNIGWSSPGLVNAAAGLADKAGHVCNWGVGADGGVFTAALLSRAFFAKDVEEAIRGARAVLPAGSLYGELVDDALRLRKEQPDWRMTRQALVKKYSLGLGLKDDHVVPATGIGTLVGLLYGGGDFGRSMLIAQKCRYDSDCTASTTAGVIGTVLGYSRIDPQWTLPLHDAYENWCVKGLPRWMTFTDIARETVEIGEKIILANGGRVEGTGENRVYTIPDQAPRALDRDEKITPELMAENDRAMAAHFRDKLKGIAESWNPDWTLTMASFETRPEILDSYMTRKGVLRIQPGPRGAVLERTVALAPKKHHYLKVGIAHHPNRVVETTGQTEMGGWNLEVLVDGKKIGDYQVVSAGGVAVWEDPQYDLSAYAGKTVKITLKATRGVSDFYRSSATSYWSGITILTMDEPEPWR